MKDKKKVSFDERQSEQEVTSVPETDHSSQESLNFSEEKNSSSQESLKYNDEEEDKGNGKLPFQPSTANGKESTSSHNHQQSLTSSGKKRKLNKV